jgi:hypothetical protein
METKETRKGRHSKIILREKNYQKNNQIKSRK